MHYRNQSFCHRLAKNIQPSTICLVKLIKKRNMVTRRTQLITCTQFCWIGLGFQFEAHDLCPLSLPVGSSLPKACSQKPILLLNKFKVNFLKVQLFSLLLLNKTQDHLEFWIIFVPFLLFSNSHVKINTRTLSSFTSSV